MICDYLKKKKQTLMMLHIPMGKKNRPHFSATQNYVKIRSQN